MLTEADKLDVQFKEGSGEFSAVVDIAFDRHIKRLHLAKIGVVGFEPIWYSWKVKIQEL